MIVLLAEVLLLFIFGVAFTLLTVFCSAMLKYASQKCDRNAAQTLNTPPVSNRNSMVIDLLPPSYNQSVADNCEHDYQLPTYDQIYTIASNSFGVKVLTYKLFAVISSSSFKILFLQDAV